jgi:membrane associated rhomboid family serine protease
MFPPSDYSHGSIARDQGNNIWVWVYGGMIEFV